MCAIWNRTAMEGKRRAAQMGYCWVIPNPNFDPTAPHLYYETDNLTELPPGHEFGVCYAQSGALVWPIGQATG